MGMKTSAGFTLALAALLGAPRAAPAQGNSLRVAAARVEVRSDASRWTLSPAAWTGGTVTLAMDGVPLETALIEVARQAALRLTQPGLPVEAGLHRAGPRGDLQRDQPAGRRYLSF